MMSIFSSAPGKSILGFDLVGPLEARSVVSFTLDKFSSLLSVISLMADGLAGSMNLELDSCTCSSLVTN